MSARFRSSTARRWLILFAIGLANLPVVLRADDDPLPTKPVSVAAGVPAEISLTSSPDISTPGDLAANLPEPASPILAPPPDAPTPAAPVAAPVEEAATPELKIHPAGKIRYDRGIRDSMGTITKRPEPDVAGEVPAFFAEVATMRKNKDVINAVDYLHHVVTKGNILPQYRARAMLELADCLESLDQSAEALCWLKIWMQLYGTRPEAAAVAYRVGALYKSMGLPEMARDAYYLSLAHSVNEGQVNNDNDLKQYTRLTVGTLWAMAANEYESGEWDRAAELFGRYQNEAKTASPLSLENAAFLQADSYYQGHQADPAIALYESTLKKHPFNPLALQARLRLYHLDLIKNAPEKAAAELAALIWTVRTVYPQQEAYWKKRTAEMLLAINKKDTVILPPLVAGAFRLEKEGKPWQDSLNHYDTLVGYQTAKNALKDTSESATVPKKYATLEVTEQAELAKADRQLNQLLPPPVTQ